jgi:hypothetical protein
MSTSAAMAAFAAALSNNSIKTDSFNESIQKTESDQTKMLRNTTSSCNNATASNDNFLTSNTAAAIASSIMAAAAVASNNMNNAVNNQHLSSSMKHSIKLCRRRKARTVFSDQQLNGLEKRFESQKYLSTPERVELANNLGLSETQVSLVVVNIFFLSISFFT